MLLLPNTTSHNKKARSKHRHASPCTTTMHTCFDLLSPQIRQCLHLEMRLSLFYTRPDAREPTTNGCVYLQSPPAHSHSSPPITLGHHLPSHPTFTVNSNPPISSSTSPPHHPSQTTIPISHGRLISPNFLAVFIFET